MSSDLKFEETGLPCPCGASSDAFAVNIDGSAKCFSCSKFFKKGSFSDLETHEEEKEEILTTGVESYDFIPLRGISRKTMEFFDVLTKTIDGKPVSQLYPYPNGSGKIRNLPKDFKTTGPIGAAHLFGKDKFPAGSKPGIIITEGELDAMSVYDMLHGKYAVVSVKNAATAFGDVKAEWDYINSFDKIYLCLDNDGKVGNKSTNLIASSGLFDYEKLYRIPLRLKDANEYLEANLVSEFVSSFHSARRSMPDSIIHDFGDIRDALRRTQDGPLVDYPFNGLTECLYGLHRSEMVLIKGLEGRGKTEICKAILHRALKQTGVRAATIFLEETEDVTIKAVATYELGIPCNLQTQVISEEEILEGYKKAVQNDESKLYIQKHIVTDDTDQFIDNIRFLVSVCGCNLIFLDNLTVLVSGRVEGDDSERLRIDSLIHRLRNLVLELNFCLVLVAHVNDMGQTRGSRLPDKLANTVISMTRDIMAPDVQTRNIANFFVEKARIQGGKTGPAGNAYFDPISFRLRDVTDEDRASPNVILPSFLED